MKIRGFKWLGQSAGHGFEESTFSEERFQLALLSDHILAVKRTIERGRRDRAFMYPSNMCLIEPDDELVDSILAAEAAEEEPKRKGKRGS